MCVPYCVCVCAILCVFVCVPHCVGQSSEAEKSRVGQWYLQSPLAISPSPGWSCIPPSLYILNIIIIIIIIILLILLLIIIVFIIFLIILTLYQVVICSRIPSLSFHFQCNHHHSHHSIPVFSCSRCFVLNKMFCIL